MKINELINEAPLPDEWDTAVFSPKTAIKKQVDYVLANSPKIGAGTSRIVTTIMYQGRPTALKVAKNKKGLAQNKAEVEIASDGYAKNIEIIIPLIDWDKENSPPRWVQFEVAEKISEKKLCSMLKCTYLEDLIEYANIMIGKTADPNHTKAKSIVLRNANSDEDHDIFCNYANDLAALADSFDIELVDFGRCRNWGIYKGRPVIIDLGFTTGVYSAYYS